MFRTLVVLMFVAISLLLLEVNGSKRCLPESPDEYICTEAAIFGEDRTQLSELYSGYSGGVKQQVEGSESEKVETAKTILSMTVYLRDLFKTHPDIAPKCKNNHELCAFWASVDKCDTNRIYMLKNCAPACRFCVLAYTNMGEYFDPPR